MKRVFHVNGERRDPTEEEKERLCDTFITALGDRRVEKKEDLKEKQTES